MHEEILELTKKLIAVPSVSANIEESNRVLKGAEEQLKGFKVKKFTKEKIPSLYFYTGKNPTDKHKIILNAHLDVVPATKSQFKPRIKGHRLFGRGAQDMKASASVMMHVFKELAHNLPYSIALQLVTDEEIGGRRGTGYQVENGIKAEFALVGEKTSLMIDRKAKGVLRIKLLAKGITAHGAYPWEGDNAILTLLRAIRKIHTVYPIPRKRIWRTTASLTNISTNNTAPNKIPDRAEAFFDIRYVPKDEMRVIPSLLAVLPEHVTLEIQRTDSPVFTNERDPFLKALKKSISTITGEKAKKITNHGSSDMRYFYAKGIPSAAFGPKGKNQHADNEWVNINSLWTQYEILKNFLITL